MRPIDIDKDRVFKMEDPGAYMVEVKKSAAKETDSAANSDRMP
jgi:hypothetical protein